FARRVVGGVTHRGHARHLLHQGLLDALLQGHVGHAAAVAAAAEAQHHDAVRGHFLQADVPAMLGELRIDLLLDGPAHALDQRRRLARRHALDLRRAALQLAAGGNAFVVDAGAVQERHAGRVQPQGEAFAVDRPFVAGQFAAFGELQAHVGARRTGIARGQAHAEAGDGLALDQFAEMRLRGFGNLDHVGPYTAPINSRTCRYARFRRSGYAAILAMPPRHAPPHPPIPAQAMPAVHAPRRRTPMADLVPLAQARCAPRRGSEHRLTDASIRELLAQVDGWELVEHGHALRRTFSFKDYYRTMSFVNALAQDRKSVV